ncbi:hypothetical protein SDC9_179954 [bioreactor metagenome]|uniref:Uncharacterized protein n=1 Tax=bioreactor metagenome TaxID=1076179 RepID=A0A645H0A6_9ZZZZ
MLLLITAAGEKAVCHNRQQISGRQKRGDDEDPYARVSENNPFASKRRSGKTPFADKAAHGRNADEGKGGKRKAPHGNGHSFTNAGKVVHPRTMGIHDDRARRKEERILGQRVKHNLKKSTLDAGGGQQHKSEQYIGNLADRGIGKPLFKLLLPERQHGTHKNRAEREERKRKECPAPGQEFSPKHIVSHPDDRKYAALGDNTGKNGGGGRWRHGVRGG